MEIIEDQGIKIIIEKYKRLEPFSEGLAITYKYVKEYDKFLMGAINKDGKEVVPNMYRYMSPFSEGIASVEAVNKSMDNCGAIDRQGKVIISMNHFIVGPCFGGLIYASKDDLGFIYNKSGEIIVSQKGIKTWVKDGHNDILKDIFKDYQYKEYGGFSTSKCLGGMLPYVSGKGYGFICGKTGNVQIEANYHGYTVPDEGLIFVYPNDSCYGGFIDTQGNPKSQFKYHRHCYGFHEGLAIVLRNGYIFIDKEGNEILPGPNSEDRYADARPFSEGLAFVKKSGSDRWCVINKNGEEVVPSIFEDDNLNHSKIFSEGLALVKGENGMFGYIDKQGNTIVPFNYEYGSAFCDGLAVVKRIGKDGCVDKNGEEVIFCRYDEAYSISEDLITVRLDDNCFYIDRNGALALEPGVIKISSNCPETERNHMMNEFAKYATSIVEYYDLIIDGNVITFNTEEQRSSYKAMLLEKEKVKQYVLS